MTAQDRFTRSLVALSAAVVAGCALAVTVKVMTTDVKTTFPPRVLDQEALERQAAAFVHGATKMSRDGVLCPVAAEARPGNKFECRVDDITLVVEVVDDQGKLSMNRL